MARSGTCSRPGRRRCRRRCSPRWPSRWCTTARRTSASLHARAREAAGRLPNRERRAPLHVSGTGAMESAVVNLCSPGDRVLAVSAGQFGERWVKIARTSGCEVAELALRVGRGAGAGDVARGSTGRAASRSSSSSSRRPRPASSPTSRRSRRSEDAGALSSSTRSRASAPCRSRPTPGGSTSSSPARRRR